MSHGLSAGGVTTLYNEKTNSDHEFTLQMLSLNQANNGRHRFVVSDGEYYTQTICSQASDTAFVESPFPEFSVVKFKFRVSKCNDKMVLMILGMEAVDKSLTEQIGSPVNIKQKTGGTPQATIKQETPVKQEVKQEVNSPEATKKISITSPTPNGPPSASPGTSPPKMAASPLPMSQGTTRIVPIADLNPYMDSFTIKGRIVSKQPLRTFKGKNGSDRRVFSANIMDETMDIKVTFWDEQADKYCDALEMSKCYTISKGRLQMANSKFNDTKCEYEMSANQNCVVESCLDSEAPAVRYNFTTIDRLEELVGKNVDVIGIIQEVGPLGEITIKHGPSAGQQKNKRNIAIGDKSGLQISLTLWDDHAMAVTEESNGSVLSVRSVRVGDYNKCSINTTRSSELQVDADIKEVKELKEWFETRSDATPFQAVGGGGAGKGGGGPATRKFIKDIDAERLGFGEKPDIFSFKGTVSLWRTKDRDGNEVTWQYPSNPENKKKVVQVGDQWMDESNGKTMAAPQRRYIVGLQAADMTGHHFFTAFDDQAKILLGKSADDLHQIQQTEPNEFDGVWKAAMWGTYNFKVRAKKETYQDQDRVKCTLMECSPINFKTESKTLMEEIRRYVG